MGSTIVIQKLKESHYNKVKDAARQHIHAGESMKSEVVLQLAVRESLSKLFDVKLDYDDFDSILFKLMFTFPWVVMKQMEQEGAVEREVICRILIKGAMNDADVTNSHTTVERVEQLLPQVSHWSRMSLATYSKTSAVLQKLATDDKWSSKFDCLLPKTVARNPNIPINLQKQLAQDKNEDVRMVIAETPNTPVNLLLQLSEDEEYWVRECVWKRTDLTQNIRHKLDQEFGARPVKRSRSKQGVKSDKPSMTEKILEADPFLLATLGSFSDRKKYEEISFHLRRLYGTLPYEQRDKLLDFMSEWDRDALSKDFASCFAALFAKGTKPSFNRLLALLLDECPTPIIARAVRSNEWLERLAIATHPKAPANTLKILCNDGNKWVRQAAKQAVQQQEKAA